MLLRMWFVLREVLGPGRFVKKGLYSDFFPDAFHVKAQGTEIPPTITFVYLGTKHSWILIHKYSAHRKGISCFSGARGSYCTICTIAYNDSLQYLHDDRNNRNKKLSLISILRTVFLLTMLGSKWNKSHPLSIIAPSNTYLIFF